jgi:hypothetical protein
MKVDFYFDWYPGIDIKMSYATTEPPARILLNTRRYKFTVEIEDPNQPQTMQDVKAEMVTP